MYIVYVIYNSECGKMYIGQTINLEERLRQHNEKTFKGFTSRYRGNWSVVYQEKTKNRSDAIKREKQLKSYRGREYVKKYIPR